MQQLELLHKRNQLLYFSFITAWAFHCVTMIFGLFDYRLYYPWIALSFNLIIGLGFYFKLHPRIMQFCLLIGLNIIIVLLIMQSFYLFSVLWLVFSLIFVFIYQSNLLNTIFTVIVSVEMVLFLSCSFEDAIKQSLSSTISIFLVLLILICIIGLTQSLYITTYWHRIEKKNIAKENELLSREAYLRLFFEHANDAIAVFDLDEKIIEVNPAFEKLYGWSREECFGNSLPLVPPKNSGDAQDRSKRLFNGESFTLLETEDMKKDGTIFDAQISLSPIYNRHGEMVAVSVISRDISYIKENEKLIMKSEKLKLAGEIAAGVAHEIRNPMTVISGFVEMMNEDESSPYLDYTKIISDEIKRIDFIISEFLVLSRPHVETQSIIKIGNVLDEVTTFFQYEFQHRNITLIYPKYSFDFMILGNKNQIKQVFINLIKNAIEAIGEQGTINLEICLDNDTEFSISIKDSGCGIPAHLLDRIFEPFYTTKTKGTGLGMMITNKIIQDHGGTINIRSKEKVGTEILMKFPVLEIEHV